MGRIGFTICFYDIDILRLYVRFCGTASPLAFGRLSGKTGVTFLGLMAWFPAVETKVLAQVFGTLGLR